MGSTTIYICAGLSAPDPGTEDPDETTLYLDAGLRSDESGEETPTTNGMWFGADF